MSVAGCIAGAAVFAHLPYAKNPTLRQAIAAANVPVAGLSNTYLDWPITSWSWGCDGENYVIGYYETGGKMFGDALVGPLELAEYDARHQRWLQAHLDAPPPPLGSQRSGEGQLPLGSVLSANFAGNYIYIKLHYSPSATMTVQLSRDLKPLASFDGWLLGSLSDGTVVFQNSMVHFAPTHAARLSLFNPQTHATTRIFPLRPYGGIRAAHLKALSAAYQAIGLQWMAEHNFPTDPDAGDAYLMGRYVNEATNAAAFAVSYSFYHPGRALPASPFIDINAIYVYRHLDDPRRLQWVELAVPRSLDIRLDATIERYTTTEGLRKAFSGNEIHAI